MMEDVKVRNVQIHTWEISLSRALQMSRTIRIGRNGCRAGVTLAQRLARMGFFAVLHQHRFRRSDASLREI